MIQSLHTLVEDLTNMHSKEEVPVNKDMEEIKH